MKINKEDFIKMGRKEREAEIIEIIEDCIKKEKGCMKEDIHAEQIFEHHFAIEAMEIVLNKIKEKEQ